LEYKDNFVIFAKYIPSVMKQEIKEIENVAEKLIEHPSQGKLFEAEVV